jgi:hypothetical protein
MLQILQQIQLQMQLMQQQQTTAVGPAVAGASSASSSAGTAAISPAVRATTTRLPQRQIRHFKGRLSTLPSTLQTYPRSKRLTILNNI